MYALLLAAAVAGSPAPSCPGADPAVTDVASKLIKQGPLDHYVITTTVTNVGRESQDQDIDQRVEIVRDGVVLAPQSLPALGVGVAYKLAFAVDRPRSERRNPLTFTIRYALTRGSAQRNACNRSNDSLTKTF